MHRVLAHQSDDYAHATIFALDFFSYVYRRIYIFGVHVTNDDDLAQARTESHCHVLKVHSQLIPPVMCVVGTSLYVDLQRCP